MTAMTNRTGARTRAHIVIDATAKCPRRPFSFVPIIGMAINNQHRNANWRRVMANENASPNEGNGAFAEIALGKHLETYFDPPTAFDLETRFHRDGFVIVRDIVSEALRRAVREEVMAALQHGAERR